jgi:putative SOS response-associated peptidase YedK
MCGKFTQMLRWGELVELADLQRAFGAIVQDGTAPDDIVTVTPMRLAAVIALDDDGRRKPVAMRWGLGVKDPAAAKPHIHARAETIDTKPAFRDAFRYRRGIVAVTSFNEGREITPSKTEQHVLSPADGALIGIAVIWEREPHDRSLLSFAMVTVPPNPIVATITDRMPALIDAADWPQWLGEAPASPGALKALLKPSARALILQKAVKPVRKPPPKPDNGQPSLF